MKKGLITGANSLVNMVLLEKLIQMEYEMVVQYHRDNEITQEIKDKYPHCVFLQADFADQTSIQQFIGAAADQGPYDVIVNGAVTYNGASDDQWQEEQKNWNLWMNTFSVNTTTPALIMAQADTLLNQDGVIINISSAMGQPQFSTDQFAMYCSSKSALDALTSSFAKRWATKYRVVGIAPAYIRSAWNKNMDTESTQTLLQDHLTQKFIEPEEIADLMEAIIANPSINATTILIDGGYSSPII